MAKYKIATIPVSVIENKNQPFDLNKFLGVEDMCIIYFDYIKPVSSFYILYEEMEINNGNDEPIKSFEEWAKQNPRVTPTPMPSPIPVWYDDPYPNRTYEVGDFPPGPEITCQSGAVNSSDGNAESDIPDYLSNAERDLFDAAAVANELQRAIAEKYNGTTGADGRNGNLNG